MHKKILGVLLTLICCVSINITCAEDSTALHIRKTNDFEVNGKGTAPEWNSTAWFSLTKRKGAVSYQTKCKILYSDKGIYCLFENEDNKISATMTNDFDDIYNEDVVEVFSGRKKVRPSILNMNSLPTMWNCRFSFPTMTANSLDGGLGIMKATKKQEGVPRSVKMVNRYWVGRQSSSSPSNCSTPCKMFLPKQVCNGVPTFIESIMTMELRNGHGGPPGPTFMITKILGQWSLTDHHPKSNMIICRRPSVSENLSGY